MNFEFYNPTHLIFGAETLSQFGRIEISGDRYPAEYAKRVGK